MLEKYLPSVVAHTPPSVGRVIVADNGSTDNSLQLLAEKFPGVDTLKFDRNYGFAEGYNRAIAMVDAPYTVLLNSDVEVKDDWLTPLYKFMEGHPGYGACQPKIKSLLRPEMFEYAGAAGGYIDRNGYPYCRGRIFSEVEPDNGQYDTPPFNDVFWASGAALMVRSKLYTTLGGLDKDFFAHMEEIDLCWRIALAGYKLACVNSASVYHLGGGSLSSSNPKKTYLNFRNNLLMLHKNLPDNVRWSKLFTRRLLDTLALLKFAASGHFADAAAVVKAHNHFRRMRKAYTKHPAQNLLETTPESRVDILVEHYLHGRKRFSDLDLNN